MKKIKFLIIGFIIVLIISTCQLTGIQKNKNSNNLSSSIRSSIITNTIKPNHISEEQLNADVEAYYEYWKTSYVKESNGNTPGGGYYIKADSTGGHSYPIKSNSEAHGYGMIIFAIMGDKTYFDGMFNMYDKHRSNINSNNMSWVITEEEFSYQDGSSATDGDMDIAYALILAHDRWGSDGEIDYLYYAKKIINDGIKQSDIGSSSKRTLLGDWDSNQYSTRASDWMTEHMNIYYEYTDDTFWLDAKNTVYDLIDSITLNYSSDTGLMPDFVVESSPKPAAPHFLEGPNDGSYYYNSCRFPWRIAMDYAFYNEPSAKASVNKLLNWLKTKTNNNPYNIKAGYDLDGNVLSGSEYFTTAFAAPFIAACTVDIQHQDYLNDGWDIIKDYKESYYEDNINLLCQLYISGKWWKPGSGNSSSSSTSSISSSSESSSSSVISSSSSSTSSIASGISLDYELASEWSTGYTCKITVYNNSGSTINNWDIEWEFAGNQQVTDYWSCNITQTGNNVSASNLDYNKNIPIGGSFSFGFNVSYTGTNVIPDVFYLNGSLIGSSSSSSSTSSFSSSSESSSSISSSLSSSSISSSSSSLISSSSSSSFSSISSSSSSSSSIDDYILITAPFVKDGVGEYKWKTESIPGYINSWNLDLLEINGVNLTNIWKGGSNLPSKIDGYYYIDYKSSVNWGHFEAK